MAKIISANNGKLFEHNNQSNYEHIDFLNEEQPTGQSVITRISHAIHNRYPQ